LREGNITEAEHRAKSIPGPAGAMLLEGARNARMPKELLDELMFEKILEVKPVLDRGLAMIGVTAAVAPLLGLLGTVTGMINTFKAITVFGTGDAKSLSSGISEALITTEYGLIVAIPALLLSAFLSRRVSGYLASLERLAINLVNGMSVIRETRTAPLREAEPIAAA
jgi:biopolymer transport protein ExbB